MKERSYKQPASLSAALQPAARSCGAFQRERGTRLELVRDLNVPSQEEKETMIAAVFLPCVEVEIHFSF